MTPRAPTFRLLDARVGWDGLAEGIEGLTDPAGLTLARQSPGAIDVAVLAPWLSPAAFAWGHRRDAWYLVTSTTLLRWEPVPRAFLPPGADAARLTGATAVAARHHRVAVARLLHDEVVVFARDGADLVARVPVRRPGPLVVRPDGSVWVCERATGAIRVISPAGEPRGRLPLRLPTERAVRFAVAADHTRWLVTRDDAGHHRLWQADAGARRFTPAGVDDARRHLAANGLHSAGAGGFTLAVCHPDGGVTADPRGWDGLPLGDRPLCGERPPVRATRGQLLVGPIDSGILRCRWHRVRVDAELPRATRVTLAVATAETPEAVSPGAATGGPVEWRTFAPGPPHPEDWQQSDALDLLVDQPPGRYLYLRLRLEGDGAGTPVVRGVRLDFPRVTSMDHLPVAYRRDAIAEDFTERFISLFDAAVEDTDRAFERAPALLDTDRAPPPVLEWLGGLLDVRFDPLWDDQRRRAIIEAIPELYRRRGTLTGLRRALALTLGVEPVVDDRSADAPWGAIGRTSVLGGTRLFGRHRARFSLDASRLGQAALVSHGDPVHDARLAIAHRVFIAVPRALATAIGRDRLERTVQSQKPAHVDAIVRVGHSHFIVGAASMLGVDTLLQHPPRPILGGPKGNVRLGRESVIRPPRHGRRAGLDLGHGALLQVGGRID